MRKIAAFVLLVLFCVTLFPGRILSAEKGAELSLKGEAAAPGDTVTVEVKISDNPGINTLKIKIGYDDARLTLLSAESGGVFKDMGYLGAQTIDVNPYIMVWSRASDVSEDGTIGFLTFRVSESADPGDAALTLTCDFCTNQALLDVAVTTQDGNVQISGASPAQTPAGSTGSAVPEETTAPQQTPAAASSPQNAPASSPAAPSETERPETASPKVPSERDEDTEASRMWLLLLLLIPIAAAAAVLIYRKKKP